MVGRLALWIEQERAGWNLRGVDVLENQGVTVHPVFDHEMNVRDYKAVYVGSVDACKRWPPREEDFVKVDIDAEMSYVHAMVLIETAVEGVAGR